jgi:hypothetical protein
MEYEKGGESTMRRMVILLTIALFMTLVTALSASAVFADASPPSQASCGITEAESHATDQAVEHIPATEPGPVECKADPI